MSSEGKVTQFQPGKSGNPAGRPKGSKNAITLLKQSLELQLREQAAPDLSAVLDRAIEMAIEGHAGMIKLLLELHMSKSNNDESASGGEKVAIQINSHAPQSVEVIDITSENQPQEEDNESEL